MQPVNKTTYDKESLNYCFFQIGKDENDISIEFIWENLEEKFKKKIEFKFEEIIKLPEGEELSKLIMGLSLKHDFINNEKEQIKLSKLYQVLSNYTTLYAEIEGDKSIKDKMNTFTKKHSLKKIGKSYHYSQNLWDMKIDKSSSLTERSFNTPIRLYSAKPRKRRMYSGLNYICCICCLTLFVVFCLLMILLLIKKLIK